MNDDPRPAPAAETTVRHWDAVYTGLGNDQTSWFQPTPTVSLELISSLGLGPHDPILDVGAGASTLLEELLARGHDDLTALDVSPRALADTRERPAVRAAVADGRAQTVVGDLLTWVPPRRYACWHDRAVFHFLTEPADRARYRERLVAALCPVGYAVIGVFADDGPTRCSGLAVARYDPESLAAALTAGTDLTPLASRRELHRTPDGRPQPFTWCVLRSGD